MLVQEVTNIYYSNADRRTYLQFLLDASLYMNILQHTCERVFTLQTSCTKKRKKTHMFTKGPQKRAKPFLHKYIKFQTILQTALHIGQFA